MSPSRRRHRLIAKAEFLEIHNLRHSRAVPGYPLGHDLFHCPENICADFSFVPLRTRPHSIAADSPDNVARNLLCN
jgi:hypothetical protein